MISDIVSGSSSGNIYLNVVIRINEDTRVAYLKTFELSLSTALPKPLWESEKYVAQARMTPMPVDPYALLDFETFRAWMTVYELVMRDEGLIGTRQQVILGLDDESEEVMSGERQGVHV